MKRCKWCEGDKLYEEYHDKEWGVPIHDDRLFFEMLTLEGAQAGLSWITILKRRTGYKKAFDNFDVHKISRYDQKKIEELIKNEGIIRNRLKINSVIKNAKAFIKIQQELGSFDKYIWSFVGEKQIQNKFKSINEIPAETELSKKISNDLKKRGMSFVGPTIIYAFLQATGLVDDHTTDCFRHRKEFKNNN